MKKIVLTSFLFAVALLAVAQQSYTIEGPRTVRELEASGAGNHYTFFKFSNSSLVALADSNTTDWDIAFRSTSVILNDGTNGPGTVSGQLLSSTSFTTLEELPITGYTAAPAISWYSYNSASHVISPYTDRVLAIKLANGDYVKLEFLSYYLGVPENPTMANTTRYYTFRYQISSANDFSSMNTKLTNVRADLPGNHYQFLNLAEGDSIASADSVSAKWNIAFRGTTIIVNSGTSGPSTDQAQVVVSAYDGYLLAPSGGWNSDNSLTPAYAIPTGSGNGWYNYNPSTHLISPIAGNTILVKTSDGKYVKVKIESYYKDGNTSLATKYYTFSYFYQPYFSDDLKTDVTGTTTGVFNRSAKEELQVYPQPLATDAQVVMIDGKGTEQGQVTVYNSLGELVYITTLNEGVVELNGWNKKPGCYVLKCISNDKVFSQRIVVQ